MNGASSIHLSIFGMHPVIVHGSEEMKRENLPRIVNGDLHVCFGVTEPEAGLDTTRITTFARRDGDRLRRQRPQGVDLQGHGVGEDPAADPHDEVRGRRRRRPTA